MACLEPAHSLYPKTSSCSGCGVVAFSLPERATLTQAVIILVCISFALAFFNPPVLAQTPGLGDTTSTPVPGVPHDYITGLYEIVNPANGSLSVRIPQPYPHERNPNWPQYAFSYDSNLQLTLSPTWTLNTGTDTWVLTQLAAGYQPPQYFSASILSACIGNPNSCTNYQCKVYNNFIQVDPEGGRHALGIQQSVDSIGGPTACSYFNVGPDVLQGGDERYKATLTAGGSGAVSIWDLHGNIPAVNSNLLQEDVNGNYLNTTDRSASAIKPTPDAIQNETLNFPANLTFPFTVVNEGGGGNGCDFSAISTGPGNGLSESFSAVKSVTLPNTEAYQFQYDPTYQLLSQITYPTGATVTYTWSTIPNMEGVQYASQASSQAQCGIQYSWFAITKRVVSVNGVNTQEQDFSYQTIWPTMPSYKWTSKTTTVTTKDLVRGTQFNTVYTYSPMLPPVSSYPAWADLGYMPVENTVSYYDTSGNLLKTVTKVWGSTNLMTAECETLPNGKTSGKFYQYATYSPTGWNSVGGGAGVATTLPTDVAEYDYGTVTTVCAQPSTAPIRDTATTYASLGNTPLVPNWPSLLDRPATVEVCVNATCANNGTVLSETKYTYDGGTNPPTAPASVSPTPYGHDETRYGNGSTAWRGNPTTVQKLCMGTAPCTPSVTTYTYDTTGQMVSSTDSNGNVTSYSYADNYTTDDGALPSGVNTNAYLTKITEPTTNSVAHVTRFQYGYEDGKLRNKTDENGQVTTYCYWTRGCSGSTFDPFVRFTGIQYPAPYSAGMNTFMYNDFGSTPSVVATKAITSSVSMTTTTTYDAMGRPTQTTLSSDPDGATNTVTTYDGMGKTFQVYNPTRCSTPTSNCGETTWGVTTYTYDSLGRTTNVAKPDGSAVNSVYSSNCTTITDETGKLRLSCSDALGRLTQVEEPGPGATPSTAGTGTVTIGGSEQTETGTPGSGNATVGGDLACVWEGSTGSGAYVPTSGQVTLTVSGVQVGSVTTNFGGSCTSSGTFTANPTLSQIASTLASGLTNSGAGVTAIANGTTIQITADKTGSGTDYPVSSSYTAAIPGYEVSVSVPATLTGGSGSGSVSDSGTVSITVDGFVASASYGSGSTASGIASSLASALNAGSPVQAVANGGTITLTATDLGSATNYSLTTSVSWNENDFSNPSFSATPSGQALTGGTDGTLGNTPLMTLYNYDGLSNLTCGVQKGTDTTQFSTCSAASATWRPRSFVYNSLSQLVSATNPESGNITYTYDGNGNLTTRTAPKPGQTGSLQTTTTYTYDALNRLTGKTYTDPDTGVDVYGYDGTTIKGCPGPKPPTITPSATNLVGRRSSMCFSQSASSWSYDSMGRPLVELRTNNGSSAATLPVKYSYNLDGSLNSLTYPSGDVLTYTVGGADRVTQVSDSNGINYVGYSSTNATYAPTGALATMVNGYTSSFPGIATSNIYNDRGQPFQLYASVSGTAIFDLCYDFHLGVAISSSYCPSLGRNITGDNGNVFQIVNNVDSTRSAVFAYDNLNRIQQANTINTNSSNCWGEAYTIDYWGNLTARSAPSGMAGSCLTEPLSLSATNANQLQGICTGACYDAAGNLIKDASGSSVVYDTEDRISSYAQIRYYYDGDGLRTEKSSGTMYWPGPGGETLAETDLNGNINEEYVFFNGERIARVDRPSGNVSYYFSNHLGSASVVTNSVGLIQAEYDYYPFGGIAYSSGSDPNHYKFNGKERDSESNLDNFGARYFGSSMGRFMTPDWAARPTAVPYAQFGDPQSLNLYTYVRNDPVSRADADGHCYFGQCDDSGTFDGPGSLIGAFTGYMASWNGGSHSINSDASTTTLLDMMMQIAQENEQAQNANTTVTVNGGVVTSTTTTTTTITTTNPDGTRNVQTNVQSTTTTAVYQEGTGNFQSARQTTQSITDLYGKQIVGSTSEKQLNENQALSVIGGEGMSQARQGALPGVGLRFFDNMLNEFLHPSWGTIERAAGGAIMGACLVGEPCGAFEAGASLVVGGAAVAGSLNNQ